MDLKVDRDKAILLMKEIAELWNGLPWYDVTCKNDKTKEETELYEIHGNMDLIEKTLQKLFGIHYEKELNE